MAIFADFKFINFPYHNQIGILGDHFHHTHPLCAKALINFIGQYFLFLVELMQTSKVKSEVPLTPISLTDIKTSNFHLKVVGSIPTLEKLNFNENNFFKACIF